MSAPTGNPMWLGTQEPSTARLVFSSNLLLKVLNASSSLPLLLVHAVCFMLQFESESHICEYSDKTIGDHVEALLGWFIYMTHSRTRGGGEVEFGERVHDTMNMLNQALFSAWVLGTFFADF